MNAIINRSNHAAHRAHQNVDTSIFITTGCLFTDGYKAVQKGVSAKNKVQKVIAGSHLKIKAIHNQLINIL